MIKRILSVRFVKAVNKFLLSLFYDKKYLTGKYFDDRFDGFIWAWRGVFRSGYMRRHGVFWPVGKNVRIPNGKNISFDVSSINVFNNWGGYFQSYKGRITIGKDCYFAQNVGIITDNHDPQNPDLYLPGEDVSIDDHCWLGMNSVILPGVHLGSYTTVGAGSVVTKSFEGNCIIAGNPARVIRKFQ